MSQISLMCSFYICMGIISWSFFFFFNYTFTRIFHTTSVEHLLGISLWCHTFLQTYVIRQYFEYMIFSLTHILFDPNMFWDSGTTVFCRTVDGNPGDKACWRRRRRQTCRGPTALVPGCCLLPDSYSNFWFLKIIQNSSNKFPFLIYLIWADNFNQKKVTSRRRV